jgi:hypothetical protein
MTQPLEYSTVQFQSLDNSEFLKPDNHNGYRGFGFGIPGGYRMNLLVLAHEI